jgi:hypothetical protein
MNFTSFSRESGGNALLTLTGIAPDASPVDRRAIQTNWIEYFTHNRSQRIPIPWERGVAVEPGLRTPLARSLQRFQLGESGGGAHLARVASREGDTTGVPGYAAAIRLFLEEEREHAALMAKVLTALGAPPLRSHWSNTIFRLACALSGLHLELMVLLVTETIAKQYFSLLYASSDDPVLKSVCAQIGLDEDGHIEFHCDALRPRLSSLPPVTCRIVRRAWQLFFDLVCLLVICDHRALLHATGVPARAFWDDCRWFFDKTVTTQVLEPTVSPKPGTKTPA